MNLCSRCVLLLGPSGPYLLAIILSFKGFLGFLFLSNPILLVLLDFFLCFLCVFSSLLIPGMMRKAPLIRNFDLGCLRVQNKKNLQKSNYWRRGLSFLHYSAELLDYFTCSASLLPAIFRFS